MGLYILISSFIQFILGFAPLIIILWMIVKVRKAQSKKITINKKSDEILRASRHSAVNPQRNQDLLEKMKAELRQSYEQEVHPQKRNSQVQQRAKQNQQITQSTKLTNEAQLKQEKTKARLIAAQAARGNQQRVEQQSTRLSEPRIKQSDKATHKVRTQTKLAFGKKQLAQAIIYKEILDKPVSLRDE